MFHDLGKVGIPDAILLKAGKLTAAEEAVMRAHPIMSEKIVAPLASIPFFRATLPGIRHHHERMDGEGYPDRIRGSQIPLIARVILIADTYDAMTTNRPYRNGMSDEIAYKELKTFAGRQFDSQLVKIFCQSHPHWAKLEDDITAEFVAANYKKAA
jgi:HD-GYP domain-containing protein (c-di-GMP phosphodiesterase class II)